MRTLTIGVLVGLWLVSRAPIAHAFVITRDGQPAATIVVAGDANPSAQYAAACLQKYIRCMTGAKLEIVKDSGPTDGNVIIVGPSRLLDELKIRAEPVPGDSYIIRTVGKDKLVLYGHDGPFCNGSSLYEMPKGTIYSVSHFLELVGVHWLFPASVLYDPATDIGRIIPARPTLEVGDLDVRETPAFAVRGYECQMNWRWHNRTGKSLPAILGAHGWHRAMPLAKYYRENPEYYALTNGRRAYVGLTMGGPALCTTNPDVIRIFSENVAKEFQAGYKLVTIGGPDSAGQSVPICECDRCRALDLPPRPGETGPLAGTEDRFWTFMNEIAERATKGFPDCYVSVPSYGITAQLPRRVRISKRIAGEICTNEFGADIKETEKLCRKWIDRLPSGKFSIYDYEFCAWYMTQAGPLNNTDHLAAKLKLYHKLGALGVHFDSSNNEYNAYKAALLYIGARLLWNPERNLNALKDEYYRLAFGPAAAIMRRYDDLWTAPWKTVTAALKKGLDCRNAEFHIVLYPDALMDEAEGLLAKAKSIVPEGSAWAARVDYFNDAFIYWKLTLAAENYYVRVFKPGAEKSLQDTVQMKQLVDKRRDFVVSLGAKYPAGAGEPKWSLPVSPDVLSRPAVPFAADYEKLINYYKRFKTPSRKAVGWTNYHTGDGDLTEAGDGRADTLRHSGHFCQKIAAYRGRPGSDVQGIAKDLALLPIGKDYKLTVWVYLPAQGGTVVASFGIAGVADAKANASAYADRNKAGEWQKLEAKITAVIPSAFIQLKGDCTFYVDDISVVCADNPDRNYVDNPGFEEFETYSERKPVIIKRAGTPAETARLDFVEMSEKFTPEAGTYAVMCYDDRNVYIRFSCLEPDMTKIRTQAAFRDDPLIWNDDSVEVMINPEGKGVKYYHFAANAASIVYDAKVDLSKEGQFDPKTLYPLTAHEYKWDAPFRAVVGKTPGGWSAEFTIPLSALDLSAIRPGASWTVNFCRTRPREGKTEFTCWTPTYGTFQAPDKFGRVHFETAN